MEKETKYMLARWQSLQKDDGLRRAGSVARLLWLVGLALFIFLMFGIVYRLHPVAIAIAAATLGRLRAEKNALRTRVAQWLIFQRYIDWKRIQSDLSDDQKEA